MLICFCVNNYFLIWIIKYFKLLHTSLKRVCSHVGIEMLSGMDNLFFNIQQAKLAAQSGCFYELGASTYDGYYFLHIYIFIFFQKMNFCFC